MKSGTLDSAPRTYKRLVYRIIKAQLLATFLAAATFMFLDWVAAWSALLGGLICVIPNMVLAGRLGEGTAEPKMAMKRLVQGEFGKLVLTVIMFGATFMLVKPLNLLSFFGTFVGLHAFFILVPLYDRYRR